MCLAVCVCLCLCRPWHRQYLREVELALRQVSGNCELTIPYWDWTIDALFPTASPVWSIVGGNGVTGSQCVTSGPFSGFSPCIRRQWNGAYGVPSIGQIASILSGTSYNSVVAQIEAVHGSVHMFVGGHMTAHSSPHDPVFFLHHAFIDKLQDDWRKPTSQGGFGNGVGYVASLLNAPITPFGLTAADLMNSEEQLCVSYALAGTKPPCNEGLFASTSEYQYINGYNRDGYNASGYDRNGYNRYFVSSTGAYDRVTRVFNADGYDQNGYV